jgi:putative addiction module component (TIGR02574 family)
MQTKDHVLRDAMTLPPAERLELAERLFESVEGEAGVEEAWAEEIARRIAAADAGEVKPVPWAEARKRIVG